MRSCGGIGISLRTRERIGRSAGALVDTVAGSAKGLGDSRRSPSSVGEAHEELRRSKDLAGRVSGGGPIERLPPWRFRPIGVHVQRNTHRSGSRWRRSRGNGDAVADQDRVVADDHLFDEEPHDPLPLQDIKGLGRRPQACQERRSCTSSGSAPCDGVRQGGASHFRCRIPRDTTLVNDVVSCRANSDCRRVPSIRSRPSPHGARRVPDLRPPNAFRGDRIRESVPLQSRTTGGSKFGPIWRDSAPLQEGSHPVPSC